MARRRRTRTEGVAVAVRARIRGRSGMLAQLREEPLGALERRPEVLAPGHERVRLVDRDPGTMPRSTPVVIQSWNWRWHSRSGLT